MYIFFKKNSYHFSLNYQELQWLNISIYLILFQYHSKYSVKFPTAQAFGGICLVARCIIWCDQLYEMTHKRITFSLGTIRYRYLLI